MPPAQAEPGGNQVIVVAHPSSSDYSVSLLDRLTQAAAGRDDRQHRPGSAAAASICLTTKYYTARVSFLLRSELQTTDSGQALVVICHDDASIAHAKQQVAHNSSLVQTIDTKLLVHCGAMSDGSRTNLLEDWCWDHGFEQVLMRPEEECGADGRRDERFQEKVGVERIIEALQSTMWPQMQMTGVKNGSHTATSGTARGAHIGYRRQRDSGVADETGPSAVVGTRTAPVGIQGDGSANDLLRAVLYSLADEGRGAEEDPSGDDDEVELKQIEEFDQLLTGMMELRSESSSMDRDELKDRAARYAVKMMQMLGLDDDHDDDGDDRG